jgi:hypothetical protein
MEEGMQHHMEQIADDLLAGLLLAPLGFQVP